MTQLSVITVQPCSICGQVHRTALLQAMAKAADFEINEIPLSIVNPEDFRGLPWK